MKRLLLICLAALAAPGAHCAENALPENGFRAEQEGRWEDAAAIYRDALRGQPRQIDLWLRLAEIHAHLKQYDRTVEALEQATQARSEDAALWKKLSEARAMAGDKSGALVAAGRATDLAPDNPDYLHAQAQLAVWAGDNPAAAASYRKIIALAPDDGKARLGLARVNSWDGRTDEAVADYRAHLQRRPNDKEAWLELVKVEGWRGNFPAALDDLELYRERFGEDRAYLEQRARALAWLGKSVDALGIVQPLLAGTHGDPELFTTRLIALNQANRIDDALADLRTIESLRPDSKETRTLQRYLRTPQRSSVSVGANLGRDSDDLRILRMTLEGEYVMNTHTRLIAGIEGQALHARIGSGLENIDGAGSADYRRVWAGVKHRFSPALAGDFRIGGADADGSRQFTEYRGGLDMRISDDWWLRPEVERDLYAVSPRAVSLHVERQSARLLARWTPGTRYVVDAALSRDSYSDGNSRWEATLSPRRAILRTQALNVDLGLSGTWFGFAQNLDNGYYDPRRSQRYAVTGFMYWKLGDDDGVSLALSLGMQKDDSMQDFKVGGDAVVQGFFGITRDYYLRVYGSLLHNMQATSGAYRSNTFGFTLTRRF